VRGPRVFHKALVTPNITSLREKSRDLVNVEPVSIKMSWFVENCFSNSG
jgi:hypothetical protein